MRPIFNNCCCCFTLETGGQIIGWIYTIFGLLGAIGCVAFAVIFSQVEDLEEFSTAIIIVFIVLACFLLINVAAGILLILGVRQRSHRKIILILVLMVLGIISTFMDFIISVETQDIVSVIIGACIQIYFFLCILSLYNKIKHAGKPTQATQQPA